MLNGGKNTPPVSHGTDNRSSGPPAVAQCPVSHETRDRMMTLASARHPSSPSPPPSPVPAQSSTTTLSSSWWRPWAQHTPNLSSSSSPSPAAQPSPSPSRSPAETTNQLPPHPSYPRLGTTRAVSSIPRADPLPFSSSSSPPQTCPSSHFSHSLPSPNNESQATTDPTTGHWTYPSEAQFLAALRRKGHPGPSNLATLDSDMSLIVQIHNVVNERAWAAICAWEAPYNAPTLGCACAGPRLRSFVGQGRPGPWREGGGRMTPRARLYTLLGYVAPFDRHDWVVDRCGTEVEYVIDFYAGRKDGKTAAGPVSFYLDVRPKLNSWEGIKMRVFRFLGIV